MIRTIRHAIAAGKSRLPHFLDSNRALQFFNVSRFLANFLSGWVMVKAGMPIGDISLYETLFFLGNLITFFWHAGGQNALLSYFPNLDDAQREKLLFNVFVSFCVLSTLSAGMLWWSKDLVALYFQEISFVGYLPWLCLFVALNTPAFLVHLFFLLQQEPVRIIGYAAWSFSLQVAVVGFSALLGGGLSAIFMGLALLSLVRFLYALAVVYRRSIFSFDFFLMKVWLMMSVPFSLHILVGNGMEYIDGWIVNRFFPGEGVFAVFRYGARELPLVSLVVGALVTSSIPALVADPKGGAAYLKVQTARLALWLYPLSILLVFFSPLIYPWIYDEQFIESAWIFNIYLLIVIFRLLLPQVILIGKGERYVLVISAVLEALLNVTLSLWWMKSLGLWGIAFATVVANGFDKALLILYCRLKLGVSPQDYIPWKPMLVYALLLGGSFYFSLLIFHP